MEALLVLMVTALMISLFSYLPTQRISQSIELKQFQDYLTSQLYSAQEKALIEQGQISVIFTPFKPIQFYNHQSSRVYLTINPPADWQVLTQHNFYYNSWGRVNNFKTVMFQDQAGSRIQLVFQLGSGRFEFK